MDDCIFCKIAFGEVRVPRIYENENFFSIKDAHPKVEGHSLVISKKHFKNVLDMPSSLGTELIDCVKNTYAKLGKELKCEGFNVVSNNFKAGGQEVNHVHFHILPRKEDDGFRIFVNK
ncbi:MAG: HIT domain-containing protein [Nanoarchaeota archaeon]|nr:HIT domain-containing protein [Nanoarchaeota archaeon]